MSFIEMIGKADALNKVPYVPRPWDEASDVGRKARYEVIAVSEEQDLTLVYMPSNTYTPYVLAREYNAEHRDWSRAYEYYTNIDDAIMDLLEANGTKSVYQHQMERKLKAFGGSVDRLSEIATRLKDIFEEELSYLSCCGSDVSMYEIATSSDYDIEMTAEELEYFGIEKPEEESDDEDEETYTSSHYVPVIDDEDDLDGVLDRLY